MGRLSPTLLLRQPLMKVYHKSSALAVQTLTQSHNRMTTLLLLHKVPFANGRCYSPFNTSVPAPTRTLSKRYNTKIISLNRLKIKWETTHYENAKEDATVRTTNPESSSLLVDTPSRFTVTLQDQSRVTRLLINSTDIFSLITQKQSW